MYGKHLIKLTDKVHNGFLRGKVNEGSCLRYHGRNSKNIFASFSWLDMGMRPFLWCVERMQNPDPRAKKVGQIPYLSGSENVRIRGGNGQA